MEYILAVFLFAVSASVTPGPNNVLIMTSGVNFGVKKSIPLLCGICIGFAIMLLVVSFGFMQVFILYPNLHLIIKIIGVSYLLYLAWVISRSSLPISADIKPLPLSFFNGALYQWVNAKAWVVASGAVAAFTTVGASNIEQNIVIAAIFLLVSFPCVGLWLFFGSLLKRALSNNKYRSVFNNTMALLLVLSVIPVILEIKQQLLY
ncbi:Cysteine/O-acetylserine efflux protein [Pseudoalteromonas holothuriae]|uniref:Cysteine/O-acetylserine efflux protein n=1 Tax=Pseudoalteromonas holothuriae TaxID=2963714 RepID=A0A9W4VT33_9GAMM|nr:MULTISPECIES: LysE family translocator [unclassified Pseudoalteromonas]CAH9061784.1 Cysteine/O-acetylserine efflux protein [Pseudoalteromonas sp. CIP111951]CAH9062076.1 Cysteine/O-acetylserine efflux protein [Pseudoalteromonas sp. CIP111854]